MSTDNFGCNISSISMYSFRDGVPLEWVWCVFWLDLGSFLLNNLGVTGRQTTSSPLDISATLKLYKLGRELCRLE